MSDKSIKPPATSDNSLNPRLCYFNNLRFWIEFNGSCLEPNRVGFALNKIINLHITYEIKLWPFYLDNGFTLR